MMSKTITSSTDVVIIGAGISGLLCAEELRRAWQTVQLVEKGRGCGGRMATRRWAGARLDHGAQYFTVRDPRFQRYVDEWLEHGVVTEWFRQFPEDSGSVGHPRYRGIHGMTDAAKYLARNLQIHLSERVSRITWTGTEWEVASESGTCFRGGQLVITAPLPQALDLLADSAVALPGEVAGALRAIQYEKGLATLAILDGPSGLPYPGGVKVSGGILSWMADNQMKGISPEVSAVTLHADAAFAEAHWDAPNEERGPLMLDAAAAFLKADVVEYQCHRWGYAIAPAP